MILKALSLKTLALEANTSNIKCDLDAQTSQTAQYSVHLHMAVRESLSRLLFLLESNKVLQYESKTDEDLLEFHSLIQ